MPAHVNISGTWKKLKKMHVNVGGAWKPVKKAYVNVNGTWKPISMTLYPNSGFINAKKANYGFGTRCATSSGSAIVTYARWDTSSYGLIEYDLETNTLIRRRDTGSSMSNIDVFKCIPSKNIIICSQMEGSTTYMTLYNFGSFESTGSQVRTHDYARITASESRSASYVNGLDSNGSFLSKRVLGTNASVWLSRDSGGATTPIATCEHYDELCNGSMNAIKTYSGSDGKLIRSYSNISSENIAYPRQIQMTKNKFAFYASNYRNSYCDWANYDLIDRHTGNSLRKGLGYSVNSERSYGYDTNITYLSEDESKFFFCYDYNYDYDHDDKIRCVTQADVLIWEYTKKGFFTYGTVFCDDLGTFYRLKYGMGSSSGGVFYTDYQTYGF